jgi:hypothetical protein
MGPEMADYLLVYGVARFSKTSPPVLYDAKRLRVDHPDDDAAIRWVRNKVPRPPVPMVLWHIEGGKREMVWMMAV